MKFFYDSNVKASHVIELTEGICAMIANGFVTTEDSSQQGISEVNDRFDSLWWDIHDHFMNDFDMFRRRLDHVGLEPIDEVSLEDLEKASSVGGSIQSILELPDRAKAKIADGGSPEPKFSTAVDVLD